MLFVLRSGRLHPVPSPAQALAMGATYPSLFVLKRSLLNVSRLDAAFPVLPGKTYQMGDDEPWPANVLLGHPDGATWTFCVTSSVRAVLALHGCGAINKFMSGKCMSRIPQRSSDVSSEHSV